MLLLEETVTSPQNKYVSLARGLTSKKNRENSTRNGKGPGLRRKEEPGGLCKSPFHTPPNRAAAAELWLSISLQDVQHFQILSFFKR